MGARKALVRAAVPSIKRIVNEQYTRKRMKASLLEQGRVHVSSLGDLCPRQEVIAARTKTPRPDEVDVDLNLTFAHGHGMHWALQNEVMPSLGEVFVGQWHCKMCGRNQGGWGDLIPRPKQCEVCEQPGEKCMEYFELRFENTEHRISGYTDGFLEIPGADGYGVLEGKSISDFRAKDVRDVPDMSHVIQLQTYLWMTDLKWGVILYWNKGSFRNPLIEHYVERDEDTVEQIKLTLKDLWSGIETGVLPARICTSPDCKRAEGCPLVKQCFACEETI
jgi:hypothetical protein